MGIIHLGCFFIIVLLAGEAIGIKARYMSLRIPRFPRLFIDLLNFHDVEVDVSDEGDPQIVISKSMNLEEIDLDLGVGSWEPHGHKDRLLVSRVLSLDLDDFPSALEVAIFFLDEKLIDHRFRVDNSLVDRRFHPLQFFESFNFSPRPVGIGSVDILQSLFMLAFQIQLTPTADLLARV